MLNPVVLPIPFALAVIAALAVCGLLTAALHRPESVSLWPTWDAPTPPPVGRHRLESVTEPYRPTPAPFIVVTPSYIEIAAGHDDRPSEADTCELAVRIEQTRERAGNTMWSWSDSADTSELTPVQ